MTELSIVIPTYDTASMTARCCEAVLASRPESCEVIVVDDGSRDGTAEALAPLDVRVLRLDENRGFAKAANHGVAAASGRIILLLNSDTLVERGALQSILSAFDDPRVGIAGARLLNADGTPQWSGGKTPTLPWMIGVVSGAGRLARFVPRASNGTSVDWVSGAAMAIRRDAWRDAGPLSERFLFYCQDIDLCIRARRAGWSVRVVEEARVRHEVGATIADTPLRHDPERLWPDLLAWGAAHYGKRWAALARVVLVTAARLRILFRRRDAATDALMRATRRLAQSDS